MADVLCVRTTAEFRQLFDSLCLLGNTTLSEFVRRAVIGDATEIIRDAVSAGILQPSEAQLVDVPRGEAGWSEVYRRFAESLAIIFERAPMFLFRERTPAGQNHWSSREFFEARCREQGIEVPPEGETPASCVVLQKSGRLVAFDPPTGIE